VASVDAQIEARAMRPIDPTSLSILIAIGLAGISSCGTAIRAIYGVDIENPEQRAKLTRDITDLLLHGALPRDAPDDD
jgi:hypothetical protein